MFRTFAKVPLRRCLHTSTPRSTAFVRPSRAGVVLASSVAITTYLSWKTLNGDKIALDAVASLPLAKKAGSLDALDEKHAHADPVPEHEATLEEAATEPTATPTTAAAEGEEEGEASGGAFNPVTGEINWDCPCLGGMAHGPCGIQFREAFSCFVFSEKEPKGIDCVEKFKAMQSCFKEHPDVYGEDIMNDDEDDEELAPPAVDSPIDGQTTAVASDSEFQTEQPSSSSAGSS